MLSYEFLAICQTIFVCYLLIPSAICTDSTSSSSSYFPVPTSEQSKCPELLQKIIKSDCSSVHCESPVQKHSCPSDTIYRHNFSLCGCCPKCVRYLKLNEGPCDEPEVWIPDPSCKEDNHCPIGVNRCLPHLDCNPVSKQCELPPESYVADHETEECLFRKSLKRLDLHHWDPDCEADGSYSPVQCKGSHYSGECFCVDRAGSRIFGRAWRLKSENQTCACSRKVSELRDKGLISTFHCSSDGNYEPLQCDSDSGMCYCVDPQTGKIDGPTLPQAHWKLLPCYHVNLTTGEEDRKYLRRCESQFAAARAIQVTGKQHGISLELRRLNCDFDGSYAPLQTIGTINECVFKNGSRIKDFFMPKNPNMSCNCIRDIEEYLPSEDRPSRLPCEARTGNYEVAYDFGSYASCMDKDGFLYGDLVPSTLICCLLGEGCSPNTAILCSQTDTKLCSWWRFRS